MNFRNGLLFLFSIFLNSNRSYASNEVSEYLVFQPVLPSNNCVTFSVGPGTGCAWMCQYCANSLGTNNYYFTTDVCTYQSGGCVGSPQAGVSYTCCSV